MNHIKAWSKPQLIILGRGKPEESVLKHCKHLAGDGPGGSNCRQSRGGGALSKAACSGLGQS